MRLLTTFTMITVPHSAGPAPSWLLTPSWPREAVRLSAAGPARPPPAPHLGRVGGVEADQPLEDGTCTELCWISLFHPVL